MPKNIVVHITTNNEYFEKLCINLGVTIIKIEKFGDNKCCNKLRQTESAILQNADYVFLCDADIIILENLENLAIVNSDTIIAKTVDSDNPELNVLTQIYNLFNIKLPAINTLTLNAKPTFNGNFNGGFYGIPGKFLKEFGVYWQEYALKILDSQFCKEILGKAIVFVDQISFGLALNSLQYKYFILGNEWNAPIYINAKALISEAKIIHYHNFLDNNGYLDIKVIKHTSVYSGVKKINETLYKNFEHRLFQDYFTSINNKARINSKFAMHSFTLSEVGLPPRQPQCPVELREDNYEELFDADTLIFDILYSQNKLVFIAAPFLTQQMIDCLVDNININNINFSELFYEIYPSRKSLKLILRIKKIEKLIVFGKQIQLTPKFNPSIDFSRVLYTLQKDNKIEWIIDWIKFYCKYHHPTVVIIYDNNSDSYSVEYLQHVLNEMPCPVIVCSFPFKFGPKHGFGHDSDKFCQEVALEHLRYSIDVNDTTILNIDIDELLFTPNDSIFEVLVLEELTSISFDGKWIHLDKNNLNKVTLDLIRHTDHSIVDNSTEVHKKYIVSLKHLMDSSTLFTHRITGLSKYNQICRNDIIFLHFRQISTNWRYNRTVNNIQMNGTKYIRLDKIKNLINTIETNTRESHSIRNYICNQFQLSHFYKNIHGWMNFENLYTEIVQNNSNGAHFVEVGSWKGKSAAYMAVEILNSGKHIQFDCVDIWSATSHTAEHSSGYYMPELLQDKDELFNLFLKNTAPVAHAINAIRLPSVKAASLYNDSSLDFVYIDASHEYIDVRDDILAWYPKVKDGGVLAGHDYNLLGVRRAVKEFFKDKNFLLNKSSWVYHKVSLVN